MIGHLYRLLFGRLGSPAVSAAREAVRLPSAIQTRVDLPSTLALSFDGSSAIAIRVDLASGVCVAIAADSHITTRVDLASLIDLEQPA